MTNAMVYRILFLVLAVLCYWYWSAKFVPKEVRKNVADIAADGANDTLQKGYHARRTWVRLWPALACCVVPAAPLAFVNWGAAGLGFLAMVALIGGYFARWFTPLLNEARTATRPDITTWYASPASKSWPDAKIWRQVRADTAASITSGPPNPQRYANELLQKLLTRTWLYSRAAAFLLACAAVALTL
jgi:hypothetical protein